MKDTCEKARKAAVDQFEHVMTCGLAKQLCMVVGRNLAVLNPEDVQSRCELISKLCGQHGCKRQSDLCMWASQTVLNDELKFSKLCKESRTKCNEQATQTKGYIA